MSYEYFYGSQAESFSFYRIPRLLVKGEQFRSLSTDAKLLYGLLLDRMGLSMRNGWLDEQGRVFIYYTLEEIMGDLDCSHTKGCKLLAELDTDRGIGLIERRRQGQGKPARIYVKQFTTPQEAPSRAKTSESGSQDFSKEEVQTSKNEKSRIPEMRSAEFQKIDANYNNINQTDYSYTNLSIPMQEDDGGMGTGREQEDHPLLAEGHPNDGPECIPDLMSSKSKIRNIRAFLLTALQNAPLTMGPYYSAAIWQGYG